MSVRDYRDIVSKALKHLGHPYSNPPNKVVVTYLAPFLRASLSKDKNLRRAQLVEAANVVLAQPKIWSDECAPAHKPKSRKKRPDRFYASWEWKQARYEALRIHGRRCQCCGWQPGDTPHGHLVVDHIKPRRKFPLLELSVDNLQVLCNDCNMGKGAKFSDDYRAMQDWFAALMRD